MRTPQATNAAINIAARGMASLAEGSRGLEMRGAFNKARSPAGTGNMMSFKRAEPRVRQYEGTGYASPRAPRPRIEISPPTTATTVFVRPEPKTPDRKSQAIRDSACGEECTVRIIGACNFDPATTVWSHLPSIDGGRGLGMKAIDEAGCYSCACCHDVVDGRRPLPPGASPLSVQLDWHRGHIRSLVRLKQKGLI